MRGSKQRFRSNVELNYSLRPFRRCRYKSTQTQMQMHNTLDKKKALNHDAYRKPVILQSICHAFAKKKCKNCILIHTFSLPFMSVKGEAARNKARNTPLKATHHASFPELVPDVRMEIALDSGKTGKIRFPRRSKKSCPRTASTFWHTVFFVCVCVCPIYHLQFHHPRLCGFVKLPVLLSGKQGQENHSALCRDIWR